MHGLIFPASQRQQRRASRARWRNGKNLAVLRAFTAAKIHRGEPIERLPLEDAAARTGSSYGYSWAADVLLTAKNTELVEQVIRGEIPLVLAAEKMGRRARLISALSEASPEDTHAAFTLIGVDEIFTRLTLEL
jgi:hypothetical protein